MMAANLISPRLIDRLPSVRGRYSENTALSGITWFRVGGPAEVIFRPADVQDLQNFLQAKPSDVPVTVIGVGSNLLVRDGGVPGVVIRLGRGFAEIKAQGEMISAGAAALDINVSLAALDAGLERFEFLRGIPGTIGGALRMNAGAYGREIGDILVGAEAVDAHGKLHRLSTADLRLSYRHCGLPEDFIFTGARLRGQVGDKPTIEARMRQISEEREKTQPVRSRTGGSTFANPTGHKAWSLIDAVGGRGLQWGGAQVSELHCNFLLNTGAATAADLEGLGEELRRRVFERFGVTLDWEIHRIGRPATELKRIAP